MNEAKAGTGPMDPKLETNDSRSAAGKNRRTQALLFFAVTLISLSTLAFAQSYEELTESLRVIRSADRQIEGLTARQVKVRAAWESGKMIDDYALIINKRASEVVNQLASDLKDDPSRLYYALQFYRAYSETPPKLDLHWGFYQYLLAINDPRERDALAERAFREKWNWDKLRAEVKLANRDNKEYVFTDVPGKTGVYRIVKAKRGPYRGKLVLDLGFSNYYLPSQKIKLPEYEIVKTKCADWSSPHASSGDPWIPVTRHCTFESAAGAEKDLFTYSADIIKVMDGDTFQAMIDLGFGVTTLQTFRLWGLDAPEMNLLEGRASKKYMEEAVASGSITLRAGRMDKYGRFLADVWSSPKGSSAPLYINQELIARGLAAAQERS